jgi:hypothetical protein
MKVKIGKYPTHLVCKLYRNYMDNKYNYIWPKGQHTKFEVFLENIEDFIQDYIYNPLNQLWFFKQEQKVSIHIDNWDVWSMDSTLAHVVVPMLELLKENKHGAPCVDYEDVPEELKPTQEEINQYNIDGTTDDKFFKRWDYVLDEMIFSFKFARDEDVMDYWDKDDRSKMEDIQRRVDNGLRLFAKYYFGLWD